MGKTLLVDRKMTNYQVDTQDRPGRGGIARRETGFPMLLVTLGTTRRLEWQLGLRASGTELSV